MILYRAYTCGSPRTFLTGCVIVALFCVDILGLADDSDEASAAEALKNSLNEEQGMTHMSRISRASNYTGNLALRCTCLDCFDMTDCLVAVDAERKKKAQAAKL